MTGTFATVGYDGDADEWVVCHGNGEHSRHGTKQTAVETASDIDPVNSVMAFTKGNSNMETIRA